jgi:transcription elongation factor GreA
VVGLGAVVVAEELESGVRHRIQVVGAIEASPKQGLVSWQSPIATAVWGASVGDVVTWPAKGGVEVEIVEIGY